MWTKAGQMLEYGDKTAQLEPAAGPVRLPDERAVLVTALVHLLLLAAPVAHHHIGVDEGDAA